MVPQIRTHFNAVYGDTKKGALILRNPRPYIPSYRGIVPIILGYWGRSLQLLQLCAMHASPLRSKFGEFPCNSGKIGIYEDMHVITFIPYSDYYWVGGST